MFPRSRGITLTTTKVWFSYNRARSFGVGGAWICQKLRHTTMLPHRAHNSSCGRLNCHGFHDPLASRHIDFPRHPSLFLGCVPLQSSSLLSSLCPLPSHLQPHHRTLRRFPRNAATRCEEHRMAQPTNTKLATHDPRRHATQTRT